MISKANVFSGGRTSELPSNRVTRRNLCCFSGVKKESKSKNTDVVSFNYSQPMRHALSYPFTCFVPSKKRHQLGECVEYISTGHPCLKKLLAAEKNLEILSNDKDLGKEARLWRLISQRIRGIDVTSQFESLYSEYNDSRLCLLNTCASFFSPWPTEEYKEKALTFLGFLRTYIHHNLSDPFALLLEAMMVKEFEEDMERAIHHLEQLYLRHPMYTPAISVMAIMLQISCNENAAVDYAKEAVNKDLNNFQAVVFHGMMHPHDFRKCYAIDPMAHVKALVSHTAYHSILFGSYTVQDVGTENCSPFFDPTPCP